MFADPAPCSFGQNQWFIGSNLDLQAYGWGLQALLPGCAHWRSHTGHNLRYKPGFNVP